jgi:hypothetical protein
MQGYWQYETKLGTFRIVPRAGSFHPFFEDVDHGKLSGLAVWRRVAVSDVERLMVRRKRFEARQRP